MVQSPLSSSGAVDVLFKLWNHLPQVSTVEVPGHNEGCISLVSLIGGDSLGESSVHVGLRWDVNRADDDR